ncbi:MAG: Gfo/Idh/MocA family oxidoreductase [Clostridiales bacterium]|nr:Gfo/Idh/MocA family oxidoreductase [Clostridiales bacterium]
MKKVGFIDYYLDEWHANNYPAWFKSYSDGEMEVAYAYAKIDAPKGLTTDAWCEKFGVQKCATIEEVVQKSDYLVVLSPDNPEMHEELCQLPLTSGKPVYVDKTFAPDTATARRIVKLAEDSGTPMFSTSSIRFSEEIQALQEPSDNIDFLTAVGCCDVDIHLIHLVEPMVNIMGVGAQRLMSVGTAESPAWMIEFTGGRKAFAVMYANHESWAFKANTKDSRVLVVPDCHRFWETFMEKLVDFFRTGDVKVPHEQTIMGIELRTKMIAAMEKPYTWFDIEK